MKRTRLADNAASVADVDLHDQMLLPGFSPTLLTGDAAKKWRKLVVDSMFSTSKRTLAGTTGSRSDLRGKKPPTTKDSLVQSDRDNAVGPPDEDIQSSTAIRGLPHRDKQLPHFKRDDTTETLCYICIGPRVRGKLHMDKAKTLQVPKGPLLGKLTKGETITFMVDDGKGGKFERTVRAEECVDPPEGPKVHYYYQLPVPSV